MMTVKSSKTIDAWNNLYGKTNDFVWGKQPVPFLTEILAEMKDELTPDSRILDAGTGEGRHLPLLLSLSPHVSACDASENAIHKLPESIKDNITSAQCDLSKTPFDDESFNMITMIDVFETLPDPNDILSEMHRILSLTGKIICNIPDTDDSISSDHMKPLPDGGFLYMNSYYYRFWHPEDAIAIFEQNGFEVTTNKVYSWSEESHPEFRTGKHMHTSRVLVAERTT